MAEIGRRELLLLLLGTGREEGKVSESLGGITRLQKLLYLLQEEEGLTPTADGFEFSAYKAGPYSAKLYDDLEFLENFGLLESEVSAEATDAEAAEVDLLEFEELMGESSERDDGDSFDGLGAADAYEERQFRLTEEGLDKVKALLANQAYDPVVNGIRKVKSKYGKYSLNDLLAYVYHNYPDMTTESEIKERVLRRRPPKP